MSEHGQARTGADAEAPGQGTRPTGERNAYWRDEPLSEAEEQLLNLVLRSHHESAYRDNASTMAVVNAAISSMDYSKAIAAALMTLGGKHAPIERTYELLERTTDERGQARTDIDDLLVGGKVPGWGNSFVKGGRDPLWAGVEDCLAKHWPELHQRIGAITGLLHMADKAVFPNPSCYTAAAAIALRMPKGIAANLFVQGRLTAWSQLFLSATSKGGA